MKAAFLTDATLCIGCKACQVACKQWNGLPGFPEPEGRFEGGYDHTGALSAHDWRHVAFVEMPGPKWSFLSDVCKHCERAGCLDACPTRAIVRTEVGSVLVRDEVCNGCGYCVASCPFGVIGRSDLDGGAHKCTFCVDRQREGLEPACVKVCPTDAIVFGDLVQIRAKARERADRVGGRLWGEDLAGGLHALFVLGAPPVAYGLPESADSPSRLYLVRDAFVSLTAAIAAVALLLWSAA